MALRFITVAKIRAACGIQTDLISDADFTTIGEEAEFEAERITNTAFSPRTIIDIFEGDGTNRLVLPRNPVLKVRRIKIDTTSVTPAYTRLASESGVLWLASEAEQTIFERKSTSPLNVKIEYDYGSLEETVPIVGTTSSSASTAGNSVSIAVASSASFTVNDYAVIYGMDGYKEVFQITAKADSTHLTADNLAYPHESGSVIRKMTWPYIAERFMIVIAALMGVSRVVGASYKEIVGYTIGELQVQKGEPYTQWRETALQLRLEYDHIKGAFRIRPCTI